MGVEFIGQISTQFASEIHPSSGPAIDPDFVRRFARAHEDAGFDKVLVGHGSAVRRRARRSRPSPRRTPSGSG